MSSSDSRPLPQRTHSINAFMHASYINSLDEELRDCKRVQRQGQEEDLREALNRMMTRVEEMCAMLKSSYQATADLETQLTLAESNLKLALANNEMLEDALKNGSLSKDVGWRRSSRETGSTPLLAAVAASPPTSASSQTQHQTCIDENETQGTLDSPPGSDRDSRAASPAPPTIQNDSRFFRFRFAGSGRTTPTQPPNSPPPPPSRAVWPQRTSQPATGHLTSASLPSLVAPLPVTNGELEELREQLLVEKRKSEKIAHEKKELEGELENLSQALFEEANKMVSVERIKRAEAEDELKDVHAEKDALKAALRLIEEDRMRAESSRAPHVNGVDGSYSQRTNATTHSRTSSCEAIVSPRLAARDPRSPPPPSPPPPTAQSESQSPMALGTTTPLDEAPPSPAPLYVPPPHLAESPPTSRTGSPMPLPHPHRLSTHLRPAAAAPAPPPPSAADGFPISPWAFPREQDDADEDVVDLETTGLAVPQIVTLFSPSSEAEMTAPWGKW